MKNHLSFSSIEIGRKNQFTHNDITSVIFNNSSPIHSFSPFRNLPKFAGRRNSVSIKVTLFDKELNNFLLLSCILYKIGEIEIKDIHKVPAWMTPIIINEYFKVCKDWFDYVTNELRDYCETNLYSKIQWRTFVVNPINFFPALGMEQKLWIYANSLIDKKESQIFARDIKESILPWLNPDMYKAIKKKQENTRSNVDYEKQRQEMFEAASKLEKETSTNTRSTEQLDNIE